MKKIIVLALALMCMLTVVAFADVTVTYDIQEGNVADTYQIVATVTDPEGDFRLFAQNITFDNSIFVPVSKTKGTAIDLSSGSSTSKTPVKVYTWHDEENEEDVTASYASEPVWTVEGTDVVLDFESNLVPNEYPVNGYTLFSMHFVYADGKSADDIAADSFKLNTITYTNGDSTCYYYYGRDDEGKATNITVVNNVVPAPVVEETYWNAGNGYDLYDMAGELVANNSPVTKSNESETAVTVKYGGYYKNTANWSGAALKEAVTVDGLEIEVSYTKLPSSTDCWAYIGVLADPSIFSTGTPYNNGYVNLIRYSADNLAVYGTTAWTSTGTYGAGEGFFAIEAGDTLRVCFDKNAEGTYDITYVKNGTEFFELPVALDLEAALGGTTGYPVVSASCKGSEAGAFEYTVDVAPEEIKVAKIPVAAGDTVYEYTVDASSYTATEIDADGTYNVLVPETDSISVIVNSGYTAQKMYNVNATYEGYYTETTFAANGVLGSNEVSMRADDPQGIRFFGTVSNGILDAVSEYGFIMTAESAYNNLDDDYVLDMALVEAGKAKKGIAYDGNGTDLYFSKDDTTTVIAGVLYGIPKTAEGVQTVIVSRPYYKSGDAYVYGEEKESTLYDIAKELLKKEEYEAVWEYAQEIVDLVDGTEPELPELTTEIAIDVSSLYE